MTKKTPRKTTKKTRKTPTRKSTPKRATARKSTPKRSAPGKSTTARTPGGGPYWVGFDLGGTKMMATVFDAKLRPIGSKRRKTKGLIGAQAGMDRLCQTIDMALADAGIAPGDLGGIGVGCPGPLDLDKGVVIDMPNLGWKRVPVKRTLERRFGCAAHILNDVDAGVYGEAVAGAGKGARCVVGVFPGTGIGGGAVYEGKVVRGSKGSCMEIGHFPAVTNGPLCGCGPARLPRGRRQPPRDRCRGGQGGPTVATPPTSSRRRAPTSRRSGAERSPTRSVAVTRWSNGSCVRRHD